MEDKKKLKLGQMVQKIDATRDEKDVIDFLNYISSSEFSTEEEILESIYHVSTALLIQDVKDIVMNTKEWITWAKLTKAFVYYGDKVSQAVLLETRIRLAKELALTNIIS